MNAIASYVRGSVEELHQVRWPTRQQAVRLSLITLGFVLVTSVVLGFVDFLLTRGVSFLIG